MRLFPGNLNLIYKTDSFLKRIFWGQILEIIVELNFTEEY